MNLEMRIMDKYEVLKLWFEPSTEEHKEINIYYTISKDYIAQSKTNDMYNSRVEDVRRTQNKLLKRFGFLIPRMEERAKDDTIVYCWNTSKRIR